MQQQYTSIKNPYISSHHLMPQYSTLLLIIIHLLLNPNYSLTYILTQQFFTNSFTNEDITSNSWTINGANIPSSKYFYYCNGKQLFGGYQILSGDPTDPAWIQKTWSNLPPHYQATISMKIYKIDSWTDNSMFIMVDGISIQILTWGITTGSTDICGQPNPFLNPLNPQYNQYIYQFNKTISHFTPTLTLKLISSLSSWTGSWGIRQLNITLSSCQSSCLTCLNSIQCSTCDTGLALVGYFCECTATGVRKLILTGCPITQCVSCISTNCPVGYYIVNATSCGSCSPACATCNGPSSLPPNCLSCNTGYIDPGNGICTICYGNCASCTGTQLNQCTSCKKGKFLSGSSCDNNCPQGTYGSQSLRTCLSCISPCLSCIGSTSNLCLSCDTDYYLYQTTCYTVCPYSMIGYNGLCGSSCPLGTYLDSTNTICLNCPQFCNTCDVGGICTTCVNDTMFNPYDSLCYQPCPIGYYGDTSTNICTKCDNSCLTCSGPTSLQCNSCHPFTYLVYSTCFSICPPHTYSLNCQLCDNSCLNCLGPSPSNCTSCYKYNMLHLNLSSCLQTCLPGDIANNTAMTCLTCKIGEVGSFDQCVPCYPTCFTCFNTWFDNCENCVALAQHSSQLMYFFNNQLNVLPIIFNQHASTCIYNDTPIVYMPNIRNSHSTLYSALLYIILANLILTLLLQIIFRYKTNILIMIQTMQLLSYLYYFSTPFSQSNQIIFLLLYHAHPTAIPQLHRFFPQLMQMIPYQPNPNARYLFSRAILMRKTSVFIEDTFYLHIAMIIICLFFIIMRFLPKNYACYTKLNPYLLTYSFRIVFMELCLSALIFFTYLSLSPTIMKVSLAFLILDLIILATSFFWKVRTELEPLHSHYALFYFNELGPRKIRGEYFDIADAEANKQKQTVSSDLIYYLSKIPLIITIILFSTQPLTQSICILIYSTFLFGINFFIGYRRRIYKFMVLWNCLALIISSIFMVAMCCNIDIAILLDFWILVVFTVLLACTIGQIATNYLFFLSVLYWVLAKYFGWKRKKQG